MINIGIVDRHPVIRAGLRHLFDKYIDLRVVIDVPMQCEAAVQSPADRSDVVIIDPTPCKDGPGNVIAGLRLMLPDAGIWALTGCPADYHAIALLVQGASGFLGKDCDPLLVVEAVRTIAVGRRYFSGEVANLLARQLDRKQGGAAHQQLSGRELQVFYKLARGQTAGDVADTLALSVKTVSTYRTRLMQKLDLSSNSDLTYYALAHRLIT